MNKCGICKKVFETEEEYLTHKCTTGFNPTQIEHQDALTNGRASRIAAKALERGELKVDAKLNGENKRDRIKK